MQKCSSKTHKDIDAVSYCNQCRIYMCNKCLIHHKELFENHQMNDINKNNNEIFIDLCKKNGHEKKLEFFCKEHNELCCALCITKLEYKEYGQHQNCSIFPIEDIKEEKRNKLEANINKLKELTDDLIKNLKELKNNFEKINETKEELKLYVQKLFTKIRSALNDREDELLLDIENNFKDNFCNEDMIKESNKLPNKIMNKLENIKYKEEDWNNDNKLSELINYCINIEKDIKNIKIINYKFKNSQDFKSIDIKNLFSPEYESDKLIESIKKFGKINIDQLKKQPNFCDDLIDFSEFFGKKY